MDQEFSSPKVNFLMEGEQEDLVKYPPEPLDGGYEDWVQQHDHEMDYEKVEVVESSLDEMAPNGDAMVVV